MDKKIVNIWWEEDNLFMEDGEGQVWRLPEAEIKYFDFLGDSENLEVSQVELDDRCPLAAMIKAEEESDA